MNSTGMITRETIQVMVDQYHVALAEFEQGFDMLQQGQDRLEQVFGKHYRSYSPLVESYGISHHRSKAPQRIQRTAWRTIIQRIEIHKIISTKRKKELDEMLESGDLPPLTVDAIYDTLNGIGQNLNELAMESVAEAFEFLRPWRSEHKTNERWFVPNKVILTSMVSRLWKSWTISHYREQNLIVLDRVFHFLDGKLISDDNSYRSQLVDSIRGTSTEIDTGTTEYYEWKAHKNGNLHLKFRRLDLVEALNRYGSNGSALPAGSKLF